MAPQKEKNLSTGSKRPVIAGTPDGGWGWVVVFSACFCNIILDGIQYTFGNFVNDLKETFQADIAAVTLVGSLLSGFTNFCGPLASALINRFGFQMVGITGAITGTIGLGLSFFAPSLYMLYFTFGVLGGIGSGMLFMASLVATVMYFNKKRALATGICLAGTGIGIFSFAPFTGYLVDVAGWRYAVLTEAGFFLLGIPLGWCFRPVKLVTIDQPVSVALLQSSITDNASNISINTTADRRSLHNANFPTLQDIYISETVPQKGFDDRIASMVAERREIRVTAVTSHRLMRNQCVPCCNRLLHCRFRKAQPEFTLGDRPMYKDDIFFHGSILRLPQYSRTNSLQFNVNTVRLPTAQDVEEHHRPPCCACTESMLRTVATMLGLKLFKSFLFNCVVIASFFFTMGVFNPYVYIRQFAVFHGMTESHTPWLVSIIGLANTCGRIVCGVVVSFTTANPTIIVICTTAATACVNFVWLLPINSVVNSGALFYYAVLHGFLTAAFTSLRPLIIVECIGLEQLTNAFGLILLFQGVASTMATPLAGILVEKMRIPAFPFYMSGTLMLASSCTMTVALVYVKIKIK